MVHNLVLVDAIPYNRRLIRYLSKAIYNSRDS